MFARHLLGLAAAPSVRTFPSRGRTLLSTAGNNLEQIVADLARRVDDLERVAPREFSLVHYNVLADQYASNLQPWFLYGAEPPVSDAERAALMAALAACCSTRTS